MTHDLMESYQRPLIQSLSHVKLFTTPWTSAHQASLSITNSQSLLKLMSTESVTPSNHLLRGNLDTQSPQGCACPERGPCEVLVGRRHLQAKQGGSRGTDPLVPSLWASSLQNCTHMKSRCLSPSVLPAEPTHLHVLQLQRAAFSWGSIPEEGMATHSSILT